MDYILHTWASGNHNYIHILFSIPPPLPPPTGYLLQSNKVNKQLERERERERERKRERERERKRERGREREKK